MGAFLKYVSYIVRHKWFVFVECCRLGVFWRGLIHDLSKLRPDEWLPYQRYFYGENLVGTLDEFNRAWLLHQHRNPHHWQYWILREDDGGTFAMEMPDAYRREMLADWCGAGRALGKPDTRAWYLANRDRIVLHANTRTWVEGQLQCR